MRLTRPLLIKFKTLILAIAAGAVAGDLPLQSQTMDLRENTSIFSRSQRNRPSTRPLQQPLSTPATQTQPQATSSTSPTEQGMSNSSVPQQNNASSSIQETSAFDADANSQPVESLTRTETPAAQEPISITVGGETPGVSAPSSVASQPAAPAPEVSPILPLPNWEDTKPYRPAGQQAAGNYVLSPNDFVQINVFQENDLLTEARIADDGTINFPLIGVTKIGGRTVNEAVELIRRRLDADYIVNPQVTLTIVTYSMGRFTILGEVARPGSYDLPRGSDVTLLDAIGSAGGFTRTARESKVTVKRNVNGKEEVITLDAKRMASKSVQPFVIRDGDTINVPTTFF